jgi:asparagine synthase (glutamine-hydrolysing)
LQGELYELVRGALTSRAARERGLFEPGFIAGLLEQPNASKSNLGVNALWQAGLLELWLQEVTAA